jgi:hypothetical protein
MGWGMAKKVSEEYGEVFHYTSGPGLEGIIKSQQLWATHIMYLNDSEEYIGFFDKRLPALLERPVREAVTEVSGRPGAKKRIKSAGGVDAMIKGLKEDMRKSMRSVSLRLNEPYITAFCGSKVHQAHNDGLLSQWRGYGSGGGYAIGFRTKELEGMVQAEVEAFAYQLAGFGDVDYGGAPPHTEAAEWEAWIEKAVRELLLTNDHKATAEMGERVGALACRYKHHGFSEEAEVRIYMVPVHEDVYALGSKAGKLQPRKPTLFRSLNGTPVPYIALFGGERKLPISKVIVGPHAEKLRRVQAVELLLKANGVKADVVPSEIPYLGR